MPPTADATATPPGAAPAQSPPAAPPEREPSIAEQAEAAGKRKQDPVYHVFEASATTPPSFKLLTVDERGHEKPVHAANRREAIGKSVPRPQLDEGEDECEETFLVIRSDELQIITRKTRRQTLVDETFE